MTLFPDLIGGGYGKFLRQDVVRGEVTAPDDGYAELTSIYHEFRLVYDDTCPDTEAATILQAHLALGGAGGRCYWFEWTPTLVEAISLGTGDAFHTTFNIPGRDTTDQEFFLNGISTFANVSVENGTNGEDTVTFLSPPVIGTAITATFTGRRLRYVSSLDDAPTFEDRADGTLHWQFTLRFLEVPV